MVRGPAAFKPFLRNMRSAFPDCHVSVEDTVSQGEKIAIRLTFKGTHHGDGIGIAPTTRRVSVPGLVLMRVVNGQIAEAWNNWDQLGLLHQLDAVPAPQAGDRFLSETA